MKHLLVGLAAVSLLLQVSSLQAQDNWSEYNETVLEDSIFAIDEITVKAFHYESRLQEAPAAIAIIPALQLERNSLQSVDFTLNQIPGIYMQSASLTTNRLTIRGIGSRSPYASNKIRAYYGGIPLTNGVGETSIEDLNLAVLGSAEIIKGPASGFYGSGLGGTILFSPRQARQNQFLFDYGIGSFQSQQQHVQMALSDSSKSHFLALENIQSAGFRRNNETDRQNLNYAGQLRIDNHQLHFIANHTDLKAYIPSSINFETFEDSPQEAAGNWAAIRGYEDSEKSLFGASINSEWKNRWHSTIGLFGQRRKADELRPFNFLKESSHYLGARMVLEKTIKTTEGHWKFLLGNETFFETYHWKTYQNTEDRARGDTLSDNRERRNYFNIFTQAEYHFASKWHLSAGLNLNQTRYNYTDQFLTNGDQSGKHTFKLMYSPRLAMNYELSQRKNIYAQLSHGFSPPSLEETLLPDGDRNTAIKPESGWNFELGSRGYLFDRFYYDISAYYMTVKNLLVARRVGEDAYFGINAGKTAHPGLEYDLRYRLSLPTSPWSHQLQLNGSYSPYSFIDFVDGENDYSNNELTGSPRSQVNASYLVSFKRKIDLQLFYKHVSEIPLRDDNSIYSDAYGVVNLQAQYTREWGNFQLKAFLALNNLTDEKYSSMVLINASSFGGNAPRYYYPGASRNLNGKLQLAYFF